MRVMDQKVVVGRKRSELERMVDRATSDRKQMAVLLWNLVEGVTDGMTVADEEDQRGFTEAIGPDLTTAKSWMRQRVFGIDAREIHVNILLESWLHRGARPTDLLLSFETLSVLVGRDFLAVRTNPTRLRLDDDVELAIPVFLREICL
jgi:hypothetical protein